MGFSEFLKSLPHQFTLAEQKLLQRAFDYSKHAHGTQTRKSGEPFFNHPVAAAQILGQIFPDVTALQAALLHDITEDTAVTYDELKASFGTSVAVLVDGVTKLGAVRLRNSTDTYYVENLRKMFLASSRDIRVILIKLADRLHNMRTLTALHPSKQQKIAGETLEMYAPIAGRLGIGRWKDELETLAFQILQPKEYINTQALITEVIQHRPLKENAKKLASVLRTAGARYVEVYGRVKKPYSLYKKLQKYNNDASRVYDILALRVITKSTGDCYSALGIIHKHYQPLPGRLKDFIATPKPNGYQSLHTTVFDDSQQPIEIQLRTDLMQETAERGVAAHWFYTEQEKQKKLQTNQNLFTELYAWQEETTASPEEFLESLQIDFFQDRIFVLTPKGDVKNLPKGASIIDFAFSIHSDLALHMHGAKVNGKMTTIYHELQPGSVVEILKTKKPAIISRDWLDAAKTASARSHIRKFLAEQNQGLLQRIYELRPKSFGLPFFKRNK